MISLDITLIIQMVVVLALMVILSQFVFRPFMRVLEARKNRIEGAERKAREFQQRMEELMERYQEAIFTAEAQAATIHEEIRKESSAREKEILQKAMEDADQLTLEIRKKITEEVGKGKMELQIYARKLSQEIAGKILGRSLS